MPALASIVLPTAEEELWRYSRIGELNLADFSVGSLVTTVSGDESVVSREPRLALTDVSSEPGDAFETLHEEEVGRRSTGGARDGGAVRVATSRSQVVASPIVISHEARESGVLSFPSLEIDAAENSEVTVVERFASTVGCRSLLVPMVKIRAAQSARVTYVAINELSRDTWLIGYQRASGDRDSSISSSTIALGGDYSRVRAGVRLVGQGASAKQIALYFAD
ncbi:MAG: SufD family Fe-S cluster assembly protein, partial [Actinomycetota bacterium]